MPDGSIKPNTKKARDKLTELASEDDCQVLWKGDLEACLGITSGKAEPKWQAQHVEPLDPAVLAATHPDFVAVGEKVRKWINAAA